MKKTTLAMSAAVLALTGTAVFAAAPKATDADASRSMTRAEVVAKAGEMFAAMDANNDGVVNAADRDARRTQMFDRMDTNKDGSLSRDEFNAAHQMPNTIPGATQQGPAQGAHNHGPMAGHEAGAKDHRGPDKNGRGGMMMGQMLLKMADTNKDGAVTRAEFDAALNNHLDKVDANKDGTITAAERRAAHAEMKKQMKPQRGAAQ